LSSRLAARHAPTLLSVDLALGRLTPSRDPPTGEGGARIGDLDSRCRPPLRPERDQLCRHPVLFRRNVDRRAHTVLGGWWKL